MPGTLAAARVPASSPDLKEDFVGDPDLDLGVRRGGVPRDGRQGGLGDREQVGGDVVGDGGVDGAVEVDGRAVAECTLRLVGQVEELGAQAAGLLGAGPPARRWRCGVPG
jgi:hypothetical protein